jgi:tRNA threonylcarbamoyladenosine biosynthesis protein TsaE
MPNSHQCYRITSAGEMEALGSNMARFCHAHPLIFLLKGDLGAGKTTFARGFLRGFGYEGAVKSPTFSLLESYDVMPYRVIHFDLYRLMNVVELEGLGWADFFNGKQTCLIEWPDRAAEQLPVFDITVFFIVVDEGREVRLEAHSKLGEEILERLHEK